MGDINEQSFIDGSCQRSCVTARQRGAAWSGCRVSECSSHTLQVLFTIHLCSLPTAACCCFPQEDGVGPSEQLPSPPPDPTSSSPCQCAQARLACLTTKQFAAYLPLHSSSVLQRVLPLL